MALKNPLPAFAQRAINRDVILGPIPNIVASAASPITVKLPIILGWCYQALILEIQNLTNLSTLQKVVVRVNEDPIVTMAGPDLDAMNSYDGILSFAQTLTQFTSEGMLVIPFIRPKILAATQSLNMVDPKTPGALDLKSGDSLFFTSGSAKDLQYETGLNLGGQDANGNSVNSAVLELTFSTTGATPPAVTVTGIATPPYDGGPGLIRRIDQFSSVNFGSSNTLQKGGSINIGDPTRAMLSRLMFVQPSGFVFGPFTLTYRNTGYKNRSAQLNQFLQTLWSNQRTPFATAAAAINMLDFSEELWGDTPLYVGDATIQFQLAYTGSGTLNTPGTIYQESMGYAAGFTIPTQG